MKFHPKGILKEELLSKFQPRSTIRTDLTAILRSLRKSENRSFLNLKDLDLSRFASQLFMSSTTLIMRGMLENAASVRLLYSSLADTRPWGFRLYR